MLKLIFLIFPLFNLNFTSPSPYHPHLLPTCCSPSPHLLLSCSQQAPQLLLSSSSPAPKPLLICSSPNPHYPQHAPHPLLSPSSPALDPPPWRVQGGRAPGTCSTSRRRPGDTRSWPGQACLALPGTGQIKYNYWLNFFVTSLPTGPSKYSNVYHRTRCIHLDFYTR